MTKVNYYPLRLPTHNRIISMNNLKYIKCNFCEKRIEPKKPVISKQQSGYTNYYHPLCAKIVMLVGIKNE